MDNKKDLGQVFFNGEIINLDKAPLSDLEKKCDEIKVQKEKIKNTIINY